MSFDNGGPAFPRTGSYEEDGPAPYDSESQDGMTLLDYFAAQALPLVHQWNRKGLGDMDADEIAANAYQIAAAMLRAKADAAELSHSLATRTPTEEG